MKKITRFLLVLGIISLLGLPLAACASAPTTRRNNQPPLSWKAISPSRAHLPCTL